MPPSSSTSSEREGVGEGGGNVISEDRLPLEKDEVRLVVKGGRDGRRGYARGGVMDRVAIEKVEEKKVVV